MAQECLPSLETCACTSVPDGGEAGGGRSAAHHVHAARVRVAAEGAADPPGGQGGSMGSPFPPEQ